MAVKRSQENRINEHPSPGPEPGLANVMSSPAQSITYYAGCASSRDDRVLAPEKMKHEDLELGSGRAPGSIFKRKK